jgi:predicted RNase H-like nuclease (RuvC/YqgF family)
VRMRMTVWLTAPAMVAALCLTALPMFAQQQGSQQQPSGDPVADAARKAREQQKKEAKPKKVYTEDDLSHGKSSAWDQSQSAGSTGQQSAGGAADNTQAAATGDENAERNDEKKWRKRFQDLRDKITQSEKELDVLQRELNKSQVQYYPDPQKALMEQNQRKEINDKTSKIDAKKKEIEQLKQNFSDLEDDLRKSGGDPGWSRE